MLGVNTRDMLIKLGKIRPQTAGKAGRPLREQMITDGRIVTPNGDWSDWPTLEYPVAVRNAMIRWYGDRADRTRGQGEPE